MRENTMINNKLGGKSSMKKMARRLKDGYSAGPFTVDEIGFIQIAPAKVLAAVARGDIDLNRIAREELASRGLGLRGEWVGFKAARKVHEVGDQEGTEKAKEEKSTEQIIRKIAADHLSIDTLETRNADSLDFHEVSVWNVKAALQAAFDAGRQIHGIDDANTNRTFNRGSYEDCDP